MKDRPEFDTRRKIVDRPTAAEIAEQRRARREVVVFTNGCFDLLHAGHLHQLEASRALGDVLIVGVNSDASVRRLKGDGRPIRPESERARLLAGLACVDHVVPFPEDTPVELIRAILPDVLTKGTEYRIDEIVGAEEVRSRGGRVERIERLPGRSTTTILDRIRGSGSPGSPSASEGLDRSRDSAS